MTRLALPLPLFAFALLGACASTPPSTVTLTDAQDCPLQLVAGQTLVLSLPSNPTTGFRWQVEDAAPALLRPLGPEVFTARESHLVGGDGLSSWRFQVKHAGTGALSLSYRQPWERDATPAAQFTCRLQVR